MQYQISGTASYIHLNGRFIEGYRIAPPNQYERRIEQHWGICPHEVNNAVTAWISAVACSKPLRLARWFDVLVPQATRIVKSNYERNMDALSVNMELRALFAKAGYTD